MAIMLRCMYHITFYLALYHPSILLSPSYFIHLFRIFFGKRGIFAYSHLQKFNVLWILRGAIWHSGVGVNTTQGKIRRKKGSRRTQIATQSTYLIMYNIPGCATYSSTIVLFCVIESPQQKQCMHLSLFLLIFFYSYLIFLVKMYFFIYLFWLCEIINTPNHSCINMSLS